MSKGQGTRDKGQDVNNRRGGKVKGFFGGVAWFSEATEGDQSSLTEY